uniref:Uncharacterized protein n=1 Tax=Tanacetum cinerariifolium TaxID=118510 RepID=A0A699IS25_TANCI|nr:hypothetical protein [Tanacetum cinerariifolium]
MISVRVAEFKGIPIPYSMAMFWPRHQMKKTLNSKPSKDSPANEFDDYDIIDEYSGKFIGANEDSDKEEGFSKKFLVGDNFGHANTHSHVDNSRYGYGSSTNVIKEVIEKIPLSTISPGKLRGIVTVWDTSRFSKTSWTKGEEFIVGQGPFSRNHGMANPSECSSRPISS